MYDFIISIIEKLFGRNAKIQGQIKGNNNKQIIISIESTDKKPIKKIMQHLEASSTERVFGVKNTGLLNELKKDAIVNYSKVSVLDFLNKTLAIAIQKDDKKTIEWLQFELYGYPDNYIKIADYRKIKVRLDLGIQFSDPNRTIMDLREDPITILYGGGIDALARIFEANPNPSQISFTAPIIPSFMAMVEKFGGFNGSNFDPKKTHYLLDKLEAETMMSKIKEKALNYVSNT